MSDEEDNQLIIDELEILKNALEHKRRENLNSYGSTNTISSTNVLPKQEENFENNLMECDDIKVYDSDDESSDNTYKNYNCENLQDLLELNKKLIKTLSAAQDKMQARLLECQNNQRLLQEQISQHTSSWQAKIINFNAGMPYFKDRNYFTAPRNEDTETKKTNGELRLAQLQRINRWNQLDKLNLLKVIKNEVTLALLEKNESDKNRIDFSNSKSSQIAQDIKKAIVSLGSMKFDWLKIAANIPENKHSAEECEVMWNVFLHPDINKQKWSSKEEKELNQIVEMYEFEDWDSIAMQLKTNRSGYQCFIRYNTSNWKNLMKGQSWSPVDDRNLTSLVEKLKIGDYIPWGYMARCMGNWTKQQIYYRWNYSLQPHLKKGRFSREEDEQLLKAVEKYGPNFAKISALVMTNRTNIQLKDHYTTLTLRSGQNRKVWTIEEDQLLVKLHEKYGANWAKISKEMTEVSRVQARQRYSSILRYKQKGIDLTSIQRSSSRPIEDGITHTTVTYTTNTPWSRENKEIHVRNLQIDDKFVSYFRKLIPLRKQQEQSKVYTIEKLTEDTKKFYKALTKLNVNVKIPDYVRDNILLTESFFQLLASTKGYVEDQKTNLNENIESVRLKMFGPQEPLPENKRFIPPMPFNFRKPRYMKINSNIDLTLNTNDFHQIEVEMKCQRMQEVEEYLGHDVVMRFEKFKKLFLAPTKNPQKAYLLKCKPLEDSNCFCGDLEEINIGQLLASKSSNSEAEMIYDWSLNKIVKVNSIPEKPTTIEEVPLLVFEPNRRMLQAYQEVLSVSSNFSTESPENKGSNYKLTSEGREALDKFKRRYTQLFQIPTGISRIIPPDVVDESKFLPIVEKFNKTHRNKRPKRLLKIVNMMYVNSEE